MNAPLLDLLLSRKKFLLTGHEHPDGDCVGAQVALYHLIQAMGGDARIVNPDSMAQNLRFLRERTPIDSYRDLRELPPFDVLILIDCALLSRLGDMQAAAESGAEEVAVIDHHVGSEAGDGDTNLVDVSASASGVLVYELYKSAGIEIPDVAAEAILLSLVSDTGWFKYSNADERTMKIAGEMIGRGVEPDKLYDRLYRSNEPGTVRLLSEALSTHEFRLGNRFALAVLNQELMGRINRGGLDTDHVLEPLRSVETVEVAALFKAHPQGVKLSLRSMGDVDVNAIASIFGGGGHVKASGATLRMPMNQAITAVESEVRKAMGAR